MTTIGDVIKQIDLLALPEAAQPWDHVGLMLGCRSDKVNKVVLALDATSHALALCKKKNAELLITHHPLFFTPLYGLDYERPQHALIRDYIVSGVAVFCAHTNLDVAKGGVNDAFCDKLGLTSRSIIEGLQFGLYADLPAPVDLFSYAQTIKGLLGCLGLHMNTDENRSLQRVFICAGSFDGEAMQAIFKQDVQLVIAGEIKHSNMLALYEMGISALAVGHDVSERPVLVSLKAYLEKKIPSIGVVIDAGFDYNKVVPEPAR